MYARNLAILFFCQMIAVTGSVVLITLGGIIGSDLAANPALATLPVSAMVIATALSTIPASLLMQRIGRARGFALAALTSAGSALLALWALRAGSFPGFVLAAGSFGINMAFAQQYRFAAVESVTPAYTARAVSLVLFGAVGGAMFGPELVKRVIVPGAAHPYSALLLWLAGLFAVAAVIALGYRRPDARIDLHGDEPARPLGQIARQRLFAVAVLGAAVGYGVMSFVMTATPLSMHKVDGFSLAETAGVIRAHVLGMFLPSLVTGWLIDRFGVVGVMAGGALILIGALATGIAGHTLPHYGIALILLGVGWNFLYIGGTTLLTFSYRNAERFKVQAINDFSVFGLSATGSLLAGTIMFQFGWLVTVAAPLPLLLLVLIALAGVRRHPRLTLGSE